MHKDCPPKSPHTPHVQTILPAVPASRPAQSNSSPNTRAAPKENNFDARSKPAAIHTADQKNQWPQPAHSSAQKCRTQAAPRATTGHTPSPSLPQSLSSQIDRNTTAAKPLECGYAPLPAISSADISCKQRTCPVKVWVPRLEPDALRPQAKQE